MAPPSPPYTDVMHKVALQKASLLHEEFLILAGVLPERFEHGLGDRSPTRIPVSNGPCKPARLTISLN